ncbi:tyrosyl-tRNA synthetase [candidate division TA06 bacterium SM1_40]|uniref:Tyrosine--tRNA ligase n=2 Tax=Bacteria division TA06 TaxID=1156500 RepID=A0A0S8J845_UNCT6|nr:MAG: tyrosyl-tRNA synthetase [candidate division TA06 bacterium SM23_40]KPL05926.1 MAG: tyrosyl-tRNA synthetase [candidate division TA06 bacterium SM1_40]
MNVSAAEQLEIITAGAEEIIPEEEMALKLERALSAGTPLRVKYGADPSAPDLHLGHAVCFRKLRDFQELGHRIIFVIGDFTARIGDPSGRSETRRPLSAEEVEVNARTYMDQVYKLLDPERTEVVYNNDWLGALALADMIRLGARYTVARLLERDDFALRYANEQPIGIHELLYPLLVAYDSVMTQADVELGGTDQKFNMLIGRTIQREYGQEPQVVVTMPLLVGTDGVEKMSKSAGNYIGITESPREMYGKLMSIPDELILTYVHVALGAGPDVLEEYRRALEDGTTNPRDVKSRLARRVVESYSSREEAQAAAVEFDRVFREKGAPDEVPLFTVEGTRIWIVQLLVDAGLAVSKGEARRLIQGGGVQIDGTKVEDPEQEVDVAEERLLKAGKRRFLRVRGS